MAWHVYMVKCSDDKLFVGVATDLLLRVKRHNVGGVSRFTSARLPVTLSYAKKFEDVSSAVKWKERLKRMTQKQRKKLVDSSGKESRISGIEE